MSNQSKQQIPNPKSNAKEDTMQERKVEEFTPKHHLSSDRQTQPNHATELAMHPKKIAEITSHSRHSRMTSILFIGGPFGASKSTAVRVVATHLGIK
jgi:2-phosphoglycerate kinase